MGWLLRDFQNKWQLVILQWVCSVLQHFFCFLYRKPNSTGIQRQWDSFMALFSGVTLWHKFQEVSSQTNWLLTGKKTIIKSIRLYILVTVLHCLNDEMWFQVFQEYTSETEHVVFMFLTTMGLDFHYGSAADSPSLACSSQLFTHFFFEQ